MKPAAPASKFFISEQSADERRPIDARCIRAHDQARIRRGEREAALRYCGRHVEDQDGLQTVEAEALPHLCEEERRQTARVAADAARVQRLCLTSSGLVMRHTHCSLLLRLDFAKRNCSLMKPLKIKRGDSL